jgi:hypothetical protein
MIRLSRASIADLYIAGVFFAGSAAFTLAFFMGPLRDPVGLVIVVGLAALAEAVGVRLYFDARASVSTAAVVVAAMAYGPPGAALVTAAMAISHWATLPRRDFHKLAFNFGQYSVSGLAAAAVALGLDAALPGNPAVFVATGVLAAFAVFAVSTVAVTLVMAVTSGKPIVPLYLANFPSLLPHELALGAVAGGLAIAYASLGVAGVVVLSLPLILSRYSIKQVFDKTRENVHRLEKSNVQLQGAYTEIRNMSDELSAAYTGTLESLVAALDVRDQETRGHSVRVATHSLDIARMLGIKDEQELATIYRGALMHDVGKIGVRDAILLKPDKLTEEEWEFMRRHPAMGYRILAQVPYLRPTAKIVLAHHERWDGGGYPRRLKAENIPLGARIFAICDTYDAIISDRPYRAGQSPDAALAEILRCAGSQFDPRVVEAFEAAFPRWREEETGRNLRPLYLPAWRKKDNEAGRAAS